MVPDQRQQFEAREEMPGEKNHSAEIETEWLGEIENPDREAADA